VRGEPIAGKWALLRSLRGFFFEKKISQESGSAQFTVGVDVGAGGGQAGRFGWVPTTGGERRFGSGRPWAWDKGAPRRRAGSCYRDPRGSGTITRCDRPIRLRLPPPPPPSILGSDHGRRRRTFPAALEWRARGWPSHLISIPRRKSSGAGARRASQPRRFSRRVHVRSLGPRWRLRSAGRISKCTRRLPQVL
jgi:hypothetical protein